MREKVNFHVFEKMTPNYLEKEKVLSYYEEEEALVKFVSKVEEYYLTLFIKQLK